MSEESGSDAAGAYKGNSNFVAYTCLASIVLVALAAWGASQYNNVPMLVATMLLGIAGWYVYVTLGLSRIESEALPSQQIIILAELVLAGVCTVTLFKFVQFHVFVGSLNWAFTRGSVFIFFYMLLSSLHDYVYIPLTYVHIDNYARRFWQGVDNLVTLTETLEENGEAEEAAAMQNKMALLKSGCFEYSLEGLTGSRAWAQLLSTEPGTKKQRLAYKKIEQKFRNSRTCRLRCHDQCLDAMYHVAQFMNGEIDPEA